MPSDKPEKPKKTLRKFGIGTRNREILTKNFTIEFPTEDTDAQKSE